ncbi:MAG: hypothetical protein H8K05_17140 [Nitrospira sp.]|nr:hypothetical protein [Nitrospira sp.]
MVKIAVYLPDDYSLPCPLGEEAWRHTFIHSLEQSESGRSQVVTFAKLPEYVEVALQVIGESVRIPGSWATVNGQRMSSLVALWNRVDCYRQSLAVADKPAFCASQVGTLRAKLNCSVELCSAPCQFLCRQCTPIGSHPPTAMVHPEAQVLAVLGEIDWCPNLRRPAHL